MTISIGFIQGVGSRQLVGTPPGPPLDDLVAAMNTAGGSNGVHRLRDATLPGGIFTSLDKTNNANTITQATAAAQPVIGAQGATFDVNQNHWLLMPITGGTYTVIVSFIKDDTNSSGQMLTNQSASSRVRYLDGNAAATGGTVLVDGAGTPTQDDLYLALHQTGRRVVEMRGVSFAGDTGLRLGRGAGTSHAGLVDWFIVINEASFSGNLADIRALAVQVAQNAS